MFRMDCSRDDHQSYLRSVRSILVLLVHESSVMAVIVLCPQCVEDL